MGFLGFSLDQEGRNTLFGPTHGLTTCVSPEPMPSLKIMDDLSIVDISENPKALDVEYFTNTYLQKFISCAKENSVSFLMTEVGTDGASGLSPDEFVAYDETWLTALKINRIG